MYTVPSYQLFIYSSLRQGFHQDLFNYITRYFEFVSGATTPGTLSLLQDTAIATPGNNLIKGELYRLKNKEDYSFVFGQLDDYEGLDTEPGETPLYRREVINVRCDDGKSADAWIYWYNGDAGNLPVIRSGDALENSGLINL